MKFIFFILLLTLRTSPTWAWGFLGGVEAESQLSCPSARAALETHEIRYCVQNTQPKRFLPSSVEIQIRAAFGLWQKAIIHQIGSVALTEVDCQKDDYDVQFLFGADPASPHDAGSQRYTVVRGHLASVVIVNSEFKREVNGHLDTVVDFQNFFASEAEMVHMIKSSETNRLNVMNLASKLGKTYWDLRDSIYPMIIHEIGHTFGLCDTYKTENCDKLHSSSVQPWSVMKSAEPFYLTSDDATGVREVIKFLMQSKPKR